MTERETNELYLSWLTDLVCDRVFRKRKSWKKLFSKLYDTEFIYVMDRDSNRASDGIDLRYRFACEYKLESDLVHNYLDNRPCSVLEMMVALALRCEEEIMDDPDQGNRTGKWFGVMMRSLGLTNMDDAHFKLDAVDCILERFMSRRYHENGFGGLFTLRYPRYDMREIEIWYQMMFYLGENER